MRHIMLGSAVAAALLVGCDEEKTLVRNPKLDVPSAWAIKQTGGKDFRARFPIQLVDEFGGWDALPDTPAFRFGIATYVRIMGVSDYAICHHSSLFKKNPKARFGLPYGEEQKAKKPYTMDDFFYLKGARGDDASAREPSERTNKMRDSYRTLVEKRKDNMFDVRFYDVRPLCFLISDDFGADAAGFPAWRARHPQFAGFGTFSESDNDFNAYLNEWKRKDRHPLVRECLKRYPLTGDRGIDMTNFIVTAAAQSKKLYFGSDERSGLYSLDNVFGHHYARAGVKTLIYEVAMNATSGPWSWSGAFLRGAARQWDTKYYWYVAHCFDRADEPRSFTRDGKGSAGECYWPNRKRPLGSPRSEPHLGCGRSMLRRGYGYGWLIGCSAVEVENPHYFFLEDAPDGKFRMSPYAQDYSDVFDQAEKVDRGVPYTPVAILSSIDEHILRFAYPIGRKAPFAMNAFLFTLVPTLREEPLFLSDRKRGDIGCMWNSEFGEIWDHLVPDAGQDTATFRKALAPYRAAFLVGWFNSVSFDRESVLDYARNGGTVFLSCEQVKAGLVSEAATGVDFADQVVAAGESFFGADGEVTAFGDTYSLAVAKPDAKAVPFLKDENGATVAWTHDYGKGRFVTVAAPDFLPDRFAHPGKNQDDWWTKLQPEICSGRATFSLVKRLLACVQDETMPCRVEGDCQWGVNKTAAGWLFWAINNKGVTKFAKEPEELDPKATAHVKVSFKPCAGGHAVEFDLAPGAVKTVSFR